MSDFSCSNDIARFKLFPFTSSKTGREQARKTHGSMGRCYSDGTNVWSNGRRAQKLARTTFFLEERGTEAWEPVQSEWDKNGTRITKTERSGWNTGAEEDAKKNKGIFFPQTDRDNPKVEVSVQLSSSAHVPKWMWIPIESDLFVVKQPQWLVKCFLVRFSEQILEQYSTRTERMPLWPTDFSFVFKENCEVIRPVSWKVKGAVQKWKPWKGTSKQG